MQLKKDRISIAIDGPAGAGKSTVAQRVADQLGYVYIDTGAMYRALTLAVLKAGMQSEQREAIVQLAHHIEISLQPSQHGQTVLLNGEDVTEQIRTQEVANLVSQIATISEVRTILVTQQQRLARFGGIVMDGRDIGSRVLPDAEVKIYLTASVEERARRRHEEFQAKGIQVSFEDLLRDIRKRDETDQNRAESPLVIAEDAIVIDSTDLAIDEVVHRIVELSRNRMGEE